MELNDLKNEEFVNKNLKPLNEAYIEGRDTMVSVFCLTYNQEKYIKEALDSFLMQLVDFNVEIVVHDDASTDSTPEILQEYANKYPNIVKPFFEKENVYSRVGDTIEVERLHIKNVKGKYVSSCEGDDFWTDPYKLYLQVRALENNETCNFCVHKVQVFDLRDSTKTYVLPSFNVKSGLITSFNFIDLVNKDYPFQTSCYFMRKRVYEQFLGEYPLYAKLMPTSDEAVMYYMGNKGDVFFIDRIMSCWRKFTENSWNQTNLLKSTSKERNERRKKFANAIMEFYEYSGRKYKSCIERRNRLLIDTFLSEHNLKNIFSDKSLKRTLKKQNALNYYKLKILFWFKKN